MKLADAGVHYVLVDAPAALVDEVARATKDRDLLLFNVSARDDVLRQEQCQSHLLHVIPSHAMMMDALAQYLDIEEVARGPGVDRSAPGGRAAHLGVQPLREAVRGEDRRASAPSCSATTRGSARKNNVALLTAGADYDVVFVADTDGEFARDVPYQTVQARPVVGSEGLAAAGWHWAWERHGAPQLEGRFRKKARAPDAGTSTGPPGWR